MGVEHASKNIVIDLLMRGFDFGPCESMGENIKEEVEVVVYHHGDHASSREVPASSTNVTTVDKNTGIIILS